VRKKKPATLGAFFGGSRAAVARGREAMLIKIRVKKRNGESGEIVTQVTNGANL
jgi:hypothetical protein